MSIITDIKAREILDSRGEPTIEVEILTDLPGRGLASVPTGASIGRYEALEQRDDDPARYHGRGVLNAVSNVNKIIKQELLGKDVLDQTGIDRALVILDGSENKQNLGANALLGTSLAVAQAAAAQMHLPLYRYIRQMYNPNESAFTMPVGMFNILNGGKHATDSTDVQEFMIVPHAFPTFRESVRAAAEIFQSLGSMLDQSEFGKLVGDEGGYAKKAVSNTLALKLLVDSIEKSGYKPGEQVSIAIDSAANEFFDYEQNNYTLKKENKILTTKELVEQYRLWAKEFPIISIEDPFSQDDWNGFTALTAAMGDKIMIIGDDLFAANHMRLIQGIEKKAGNAVLVKINQIGTLSETIEFITTARKNSFKVVVSVRSGETEDTSVAHLAVAMNLKYIKAGSTSRGEHTAKYNEMMRIEEELGTNARFIGLQ